MKHAGLLFALAACSSATGPGGDDGDATPDPPALAGVTIVSTAPSDAALRELASMTPLASLTVELGPVSPRADQLTFELIDDLACAECYQLEVVGSRHVRVHTGDVLGAQYGVTALLEAMGLRFRHPLDTYVPDVLALDTQALPATLQEPWVRGPRGLQLHTLHPIEGYLALWEPAGDLGAARHIFDWIIKNRGNYVQWPALDDIMGASRHAQWKQLTQQLLEIAHLRGLGAGLSIQIFGSSNLQRAFDLSDDSGQFEQELAERLPLVTADLPFDRYSMSFGEFFGSQPQAFIDAVNTTAAAIHAAQPAATLHASIHVGGDLRVDYGGENLPYYFLVKFADPSIVPNLHTVMYYNLFEDAGGAYEQDNFDEHREYLISRLTEGKPAVYYPETAYWVAFDNSVPLYLPTYVRSRWLDLDGIRARTAGGNPLHGHLVFSSGFEWGYWLNDVASLRASYALPDRYGALVEDAFGADLAPAAPIVEELAGIQATALIDDRLAAYLAGRDALIDAGDAAGIHSQPDRLTFGELRVQPWKWSSFETNVLGKLRTLATAIDGLHARAVALALPDSRWSRELVDGLDVTAARAQFITAAYEAVLAHARGQSAARDAARARMTAAFARGNAAVRRRHADMHDADPRLTTRFTNATVYQFGYHFMTDSLCYWRREQVEVAALLDGSLEVPPTCAI